MKLKISALLVSMLFAAQSQAMNMEDMGISFGASQTNIDVESGDTSAGTGFHVGWMGYYDFMGAGKLRTGAVLTQRPFEVEDSGMTFEASVMNIEVPLTYLYNFNDMVGIYGGLQVAINVSDDCTVSMGSLSSDCDLEPEGFMYGAAVGGHFRFAENFGAELDYIMGLSDVSESVEWASSIAVSGIYFF